MKDFQFSKKLKLISVVLVVSLLLQLVPFGVLAAETESTTPSAPENYAEVLYEDISLREETVKHFKMSDGTFSAVDYSAPVHYKTDDGDYKDIDNSLESVTLADGSGFFVNKDNPFSVTFPDDLSNDREIVISKNGKTISFSLDGASNSKGVVNNNTAEKEAEKLQKELEKATTEEEKAEIKNRYAFSAEKVESRLIYKYNGYIDIEYILTGSKLKESLIIKKQTGKADFKFKYNLEGLTAELQPDNSVLVKDGEEVVFIIEAPYMFDAADNFSSDITVEIKNKNKGFEYILHADKDWLKSDDRVYPVTIDPTIQGSVGSNYTTKSATGAKTGLIESELAELEMYGNTLKVGNAYGANLYSFYYAKIPTTIPYSARITKATFNAKCRTLATTNFPIYVSEITSTWPNNKKGLTGTEVPNVSNIKSAYGNSSTLAVGAFTTFDVTSIVQSWQAGTSENYGIALYTDSAGPVTTWNFISLYSETYGNLSYNPYFVYQYADTRGVEDYWSYSTVGLPRGGVAYINRFSGQVNAQIPLISTISELLPVDLVMIYEASYIKLNSHFPLSTMSNGFKVSVDRELVPITSSNAEYAAGYRFVYYDSDGTRIYFYGTTENGVTCYKDELGYGYTITQEGTEYKLTDLNDNETWFNSAYNVTRIYSAKLKKSITVSYATVNSRQYISKVTDGAGNVLNFTRNGNQMLLKIDDGLGRYVDFVYGGVNYSQIVSAVFSDGTSINFTYCTSDSAKERFLKTVGDSTGSIEFIYYNDADGKNNGRVQKVTEKSAPDANNAVEDGNSLEFTYNAGNSTTVTSKTVSAATTDVKTHYVFDNLGRVTSSFNDYGVSSGSYNSGSTSGTTKNLKINELASSSSVSAPVYNLLFDHSFENGSSNWTLTSGATLDTANYYLGNKSLKVVGSENTLVKATQNVTLTASGAYTLSAYVKSGAGAKLIIYEDNVAIAETAVTDTAGKWERFDVTLDSAITTKSYSVALAVDNSTTTAYFDCVQLEKDISANPYNMLENSSFANGTGWTTNTSSQVAAVTYNSTNDRSSNTRPAFITKGYRVTGKIANLTYVQQKVFINKPASDIVFDIYGYSRADSVPLTDSILYALSLELVFTDGTTERINKSFNADSTAWQYATNVCAAKESNQNKTIAYVNAGFLYQKNLNTADITGIGLMVDMTGKNYTYDDRGNLTKITNLYDGKVYENSYDSLTTNELTYSSSEEDGTWWYDYVVGNTNLLQSALHLQLDYEISYTYDPASYLLTSTTISSENTNKSITTYTTYTADYDHVASVTDAAGNTITYTYDSMGRLTIAQSGNSKTTYTYDGLSDRVKTVTSDTSATTSSTVTYDYDAAGRLLTVTRGTTVYTITYDKFGNQESVTVGGVALSTNDYEDNNGTLSDILYGNGTNIAYTYDDLGRVIGKNFQTVSNGVVTSNTPGFTQQYSNSGAIAKYDDLLTNTKWNYRYDNLGRLDNISGSNGNKYKNTYDSNNRINKMTYTIGGEERSTGHSYNEMGAQDHFSVNDNHTDYLYDYLGRLSCAILNAEFSTDYTYVNINDTKTTNQVLKVTNPNSHYTNTYDSLGNVTSVTDHNGNTVTYTYDYLGQLIGETNSEGSYTVEYDAFGNITKKNGIVYGYGKEGREWQDLLTSYNGIAIDYDDIGNPDKWRGGVELHWTNGRQLSQISQGENAVATYSYDSSGIRYQKTVGNKTYTFTYVDGKLIHQTDGTNIWWFYYNATNNLVALEYNENLYYYMYDSIGNIIGLMDTNGVEVATYTYDAWGKILTSTGSMAEINPIRYKGYYYDTETGYYYLMSRYYDPVVGRFLNADGLSAGVNNNANGYNLFAYCFNNPVNMVDDSGNWPSWAKKLVAAVAVVAVVAVVAAVTVATAGAGTAIAAVAVGAAKGAAVGFAMGAASGAAIGYATTGTLEGTLNGMADGALSGAITGAITGGIQGGINYYSKPTVSPGSTQSSCPSQCFVAGTLVLTVDGPAAIEAIKTGDLVFAEDPETGEKGVKRVAQTFVNETKELIHLQVGSEEITTTPEHPFYSPVKGWTVACELHIGDVLVLQNGDYVTVEMVQHEILESPVKVYNFEVQDFHTYYVGKSAVLVHNTCSGKTTSANQMQQQVNKGQAPKQVESVHPAHTQVGGQPHIHFKDGTSLNIDGSTHDKLGGIPKITNSIRIWLEENGWWR